MLESIEPARNEGPAVINEPEYDAVGEEIVLREERAGVRPRLIDEIEPADSLNRALAVQAESILRRPGAVVKIQGGRHVTITPLEELAALCGVSTAVTHHDPMTDPLTGEVAAHVTVTVTRGDGVSSQSDGFCSSGEQVRGRRRWSDWHAVASMAETRGKVRALAGLFRPVIAIADSGVSGTPAEIMPTEPTPKPARKRASPKPSSATETMAVEAWSQLNRLRESGALTSEAAEQLRAWWHQAHPDAGDLTQKALKSLTTKQITEFIAEFQLLGNAEPF